MKTQKLLSNVMVMLTVSICLFSCEDEKENEPTCKVIETKLTDGGADTSSFFYTYNTNGKLIKSDLGEGYYTTYTWESSKLTAKVYNANSLYSTEVYMLNSDGYAESSTYALTGAQISKNKTYGYSDDGYLISKTIEPVAEGSIIDYYTYEYENGNMLAEYHEQSSEGTFSSSTTYEYYLDKKNTNNVSVSFLGKANANLTKKSISQALTPFTSILTITYTYMVAADGKVQKITQTVGANSTYTLPVYECN